MINLKQDHQLTKKEILSPGEKGNPASNEYSTIKPRAKRGNKIVQQVPSAMNRKGHHVPSDKS